GRLRHIGYAGGWKKFEPLWDWVIRAKRAGSMLPALETMLSGFGKHSAGRKPETPAMMKADPIVLRPMRHQ
ncbi:MAG TPA: hypothetical protein VE715_05455, partial [Blastocatellia bacterium]|nr:hypothetical protein [Blastocatellia bacterium]